MDLIELGKPEASRLLVYLHGKTELGQYLEDPVCLSCLFNIFVILQNYVTRIFMLFCLDVEENAVGEKGEVKIAQVLYMYMYFRNCG